MPNKFSAKKYKPIGDPKFTRVKQGRFRFYYVRFKGKFTRAEIIAFAEKKSKELKKNDPDSGHFQVTTAYEFGDYKSAGSTVPGEPVSVFEEYDGGDLGDIVGFDILFSLTD